MNSFEGAFECDVDAGVTVPSSCKPCDATRRSLRPGFCVPEPLGVNVAAAAAFGDMPMFFGCAGCAASVLGVKEGDSTLNDLVFVLVKRNSVNATSLKGLIYERGESICWGER